MVRISSQLHTPFSWSSDVSRWQLMRCTLRGALHAPPRQVDASPSLSRVPFPSPSPHAGFYPKNHPTLVVSKVQRINLLHHHKLWSLKLMQHLCVSCTEVRKILMKKRRDIYKNAPVYIVGINSHLCQYEIKNQVAPVLLFLHSPCFGNPRRPPARLSHMTTRLN